MKAAVLNAFGEALAIEALPDPVLGTAEIIVDVVAAGVASYTRDIFSKTRRYLLEPPVVPGPGGIRKVRATGSDTTKLKPGDWVLCDPTIRSRDDATRPDMMLLGWTAVSPAALPTFVWDFCGAGASSKRERDPDSQVTISGQCTH